MEGQIKTMMTKDEFAKEYGDNLRSVLKKYKITQSQLSDLSGLTKAAICRIINAQRAPTAYNAYRINCAIEEVVAKSKE